MRMRMGAIVGLFMAALCVLLASGSFAAEGSARDEFDKTYAQYKDIVKQLTALRDRYPVAAPEERPAMEQKYNDLLKEGNKLRPKTQALLEKAYAENPRDEALANMIFSIADTLVKSDDYEDGLRLDQLLIDHKYSKPQVYEFAGTAAFYANRYDLAEKYLKQAADGNAITDDGKDLQDRIKIYRDKWARELKFRDAEQRADDLPRVKLTIGDFKGNEKGSIVVELFENEAPNTVASFINLADKRFYDGLTFHRVLEHFMAQGGDPDGNGTGGPGYHIADECFEPNHREHFRGSLSMAHSSNPNSNGSQFFINFVPKADLDGKYTVFGRVIEGVDLLAKIQRTHASSEARGEVAIPGVLPDKIIKAEVLRTRPHPYEPKKLP